MLKASENPPMVFPEGKPVKQFEGTWFVAHTKARNEKALAWDMVRKKISYFLPLMKKVSKTPKGRTLRTLVPVFSGYVFFCGDQDQRVEVLRTNRAANIISCKDQQMLRAELASIQKAVEAGADLKPYNFISIGQRCRVIAGPLMGSEGIVAETSKGTRLVLQVEMLGQATSIEIESDLLETI